MVHVNPNLTDFVPTTNLTLVGYAPHNNPEVAMAVVVPWAYQGGGDDINKRIGKQALRAYFDLKAKRK